MNKDERLKLYDEAEKAWGLVAQYDQAIEEMGELIVAINKYKRKCLYGEYAHNQKVEDNLAEEIADVKMCLEQLENYVGQNKVADVFEKKLNKLQEEIIEMNNRKNS